MQDKNSDNKRIAKNTLFMYVRMLVLLVIYLYISRIVINALGVEDYGIYNVVGGVIVLFSFINGAMITGTQRHLSYELGKPGGDVAKIFSACLYVHICIALLIFLLAETVGLWFLNAKMQFPPNRLFAVNVVYQMSVANAMIEIVRVPYNAVVIAWEKMTYYAYIGIVEGVLKLLIAYVTITITCDKLIAYSILHMIVTFIIFTILVIYCHVFLNRLRLKKVHDRQLYKYLLSFSGWTLFGSAASVGETQGLNMFINIFFGVAINAAVGIANQIRSALQQFVTGFQTALNPQLVKMAAKADRGRQLDLIYKSSKYSLYILLVIAIPIMINLDFLLKIWLRQVPPYTARITNQIIVVSLFECLSSPLYTTIFAIGNIRKYQICVALLRTFSIVMGYVICRYGTEPYYIYIVPVIISVILLLYRIWFVKGKIGLKVGEYYQNVLLPIGRVFIFGVLPIILYKAIISYELNIFLWFAESFAFFTYSSMTVFYLGIASQERRIICNTITSKLKLNIFHK